METPQRWTEEIVGRAIPGVPESEGALGRTEIIRVSCDLGPFVVIAEKELASPADGPESLRIEGRWRDDESGRLDGPWGGITTETLRALPMQELRRRMARVAERELRSAGSVPALPHRTDTGAQLAQFCAVYVDLVQHGHRKPLHRLSELTGVSRNTLSARVRRAREQGILTRPTSTEAGGRLTEHGMALLKAAEEG